MFSIFVFCEVLIHSEVEVSLVFSLVFDLLQAYLTHFLGVFHMGSPVSLNINALDLYNSLSSTWGGILSASFTILAF